MMHLKRLFAAAMLALPLSACGLQPLYSNGAGSNVAQGLASVQIPAIPGRGGWLLRGELEERLGVGSNGVSASPRYRLDVRLDDSLEALGVLNDDTISRERRVLRARYQLIDSASGEILLDATAGSDAGIDVVSSEYATIAAEQTALENLSRVLADQMVTQIALTLRAEETAAAEAAEQAGQ